MARSDFYIDSTEVDTLAEAIAEYPGKAGEAIDDYLHGEGGKLINEAIIRILPESGRKWKGKKGAAKASRPFMQEDGDLSVTVRTRSAYHYLYFPDDGTNTKHHVGEQYFMIGGAENVSGIIVDKLVTKLENKFEGE